MRRMRAHPISDCGRSCLIVLAAACLVLAAATGAWASLSGSKVTFDPSAGGDTCNQPVPETYCFLAESYTPDYEYVYNLWLRFPADWTVTDVYLQGTPSCTGGGWWDSFTWSFETSPYEVNIFHPRYQAATDSCSAYYCVEATSGGYSGAADVSWYWDGDGYNSTPHWPASSDGYTPASMSGFPADEIVNPPASVPVCNNDECDGALVIPLAPSGTTRDTTTATSSGIDPAVCNGGNNNTVWYRFEAQAADGILTLDTFGSNYDTVLAVYTGDCLSATYATVACNDDYSGLQSWLQVLTAAGTDYYVVVSSYSFGGGAMVLNSSWVGDPPVDLIVDDGSMEDNIGLLGGALEFLFLNRFTPAADEFPFYLDGARVFFSSVGLVNVGDDIRIVVYENTSGNSDPAVGANLLASFPAQVKVVDGWSDYTLPTPVPFAGPGDVVIGVVALEVPGTDYWPAAIDLTGSQGRSWIGWWDSSPPPDPATLPPPNWLLTETYFPGNWMIRGYGHNGDMPPTDLLFGTVGVGSGTSTLVTLDPATGALVSTVGDVGYLVNGLDYDPVSGKLYATVSVHDPVLPGGLVVIDPGTGDGTPVVPATYTTVLNPRADWSGTIFGWAQAGGGGLASFDPAAGTATWIGESGFGTWTHGMSFDVAGTLYFVNGDGCVSTIDTATGLGASTGICIGTIAHHGDFNPATGLWWGITSAFPGPKSIAVADVQTGSLTGTLPTVADLHTLAFGPHGSPPTGTTLTPASVDEDLPSGTAVGTFSTTDPDDVTGGGVYSYWLVAGDGDGGNASFTIVGNALRTAAMFDFETQNVYSIRVRTVDGGGNVIDRIFTITVTKANEPPVLDPVGNRSVREGWPLSFTATATDPNPGQTLTFSATGLPAGAGIDPATGVFTWRPAFDQAGVYPVTITVTDDGAPPLSDFEEITITVGEGPYARNDFDGDGRADILWRNTSGKVVLWLMDGVNRLSSVLLGTVDPAWTLAATADFDGDRKTDILWYDTATGQVDIWLMDGLTIASSGTVGTYPPEMQIDQVADFDGDFKADILWLNDVGVYALLRMNGLGIIDSTWPIGNGVFPVDDPGPAWGRKVADFNGDFKADILWRNAAGIMSLWLMDGATVAWNGPLGAVDPDWQVVAAADKDGNGRSDILWRGVTGDLAYWMMDGPVLVETVGVPGHDASWEIGDFTDFDGDTRADILWRKPGMPLELWGAGGRGLAGAYDPASVLGPAWVIQNSR